MGRLKPFELEDFFYEYEHRPDLINLASSDAMPWKLRELRLRFPKIEAWIDKTGLGYPNVKDIVLPEIQAFHGDPPNTAFLPTSGAAEAIYLSLQAVQLVLSDGIAIALPTPAYGAFDGVAELLQFHSIEYYSYRPEQDWLIRNEDVLELATRCDVLVVNNPHNPTGCIMPIDLLQEIAKQLERHGGILVVDEVFLLPEDCTSSVVIAPNVLVVGSLSKVYGLAGLRLGWAAGPAKLIRMMRTLQQYSSLSINTLAAGIGSIALSRSAEFSRHKLLTGNRQVLQEWSDAHGDMLKITHPEGGTTVILEMLRPVADPEQLFNALLAAGVLLAPGWQCFGSRDPCWFRLGYGANTKDLSSGLDIIASVLRKF